MTVKRNSISALAPKPRLTKYQAQMAASVEELKSSMDEMKAEMQAQFTGFQDLMKTALEKLNGLESWRLSADESFSTLMVQSEATAARVQRLETPPPPPPPPQPSTALPRAPPPPPPPQSWINPFNLNQAPQPSTQPSPAASEQGGGTQDSPRIQDGRRSVLGPPPQPQPTMGMPSADSPPLVVHSVESSSHHPPFLKIEFPKFDGDNPRLWHDRCVMYFEVYKVHASLKTHFAALNFTGPAAIWLQTVQRKG